MSLNKVGFKVNSWGLGIEPVTDKVCSSQKFDRQKTTKAPPRV